jgi:hypothetical protein
MDHQTFDRMTRLFGTAGSRRTALRALIAGTLLGATTRGAAAKPCNKGKHLCGVGERQECCPGKCFEHECSGHQLCCTAEHNLTICGNQCCMTVDGDNNLIRDPCRPCTAPPPGPTSSGQGFCDSSIAGSYRRR